MKKIKDDGIGQRNSIDGDGGIFVSKTYFYTTARR